MTSLGEIWNAVKGIPHQLKVIAANVQTWITNAVSDLTTVVDDAETAIDGFIDSVETSLTAVIDGAEIALDTAISNAESAIDGFIDSARDTITTAIDSAETAIDGYISTAQTAIQASITSAQTAILDPINTLVANLEDNSYLADMLTGLLTGLTAANVETLADSIGAWLKTKLVIGEPLFDKFMAGLESILLNAGQDGLDRINDGSSVEYFVARVMAIIGDQYGEQI